jgi:alpha-soluble NSF attachment protein
LHCSSANKALLKVAYYSAQLESYDKAIEIYEQVAAQAIDNNLLKWGAREYYLKAGLCHMCTGVCTVHRVRRRGGR